MCSQRIYSIVQTDDGAVNEVTGVSIDGKSCEIQSQSEEQNIFQVVGHGFDLLKVTIE